MYSGGWDLRAKISPDRAGTGQSQCSMRTKRQRFGPAVSRLDERRYCAAFHRG